MASDIADNGTFVVTNMKPSPGEQADAIWAQKVAQNGGFLFARPVAWMGNEGTNGTWHNSAANPIKIAASFKCYFYRTPGHNKLKGTYYSTGSFDSTGGPDTYYSDGFSVAGDLGVYTLYQSATNANIGAHQKWGSTYKFTMDLSSYVSEGQWGTFTGTFWGTSADDSSTRTVEYAFGYPMICETYWDA